MDNQKQSQVSTKLHKIKLPLLKQKEKFAQNWKIHKFMELKSHLIRQLSNGNCNLYRATKTISNVKKT